MLGNSSGNTQDESDLLPYDARSLTETGGDEDGEGDTVYIRHRNQHHHHHANSPMSSSETSTSCVCSCRALHHTPSPLHGGSISPRPKSVCGGGSPRKLALCSPVPSTPTTAAQYLNSAGARKLAACGGGAVQEVCGGGGASVKGQSYHLLYNILARFAVKLMMSVAELGLQLGGFVQHAPRYQISKREFQISGF